MAAWLLILTEVLGIPVDTRQVSTASSNNVVRVEVSAVSPNYLRPWELMSQDKRSGSGFVVEGQRGLSILTNFHVIEGAVEIRVTKQGESKRWSATVATVGPDVDLALVDVADPAFFYNVTAVLWSEELVPRLQSRVSVHGFPRGGKAMCITEGVVSRIDCMNYRLGITSDLQPGRLMVVQIDAAINGGNSGGPCFDVNGRAIGVAFQGIDDAQSIGYIIPASVATTFIDHARRRGGSYAGVTEVPYRVHPLENSGLRARLGVPTGESGVVVTAVSPLSGVASASNVTGNGSALQVDDVIISIDGRSVGDDYSVSQREGVRFSADCLITGKRAGVPTILHILRAGRPFVIQSTLGPLPAPMGRTHGVDCAPQWLIVGGLFFVPLSAPLLDAITGDGARVPSSVNDVYMQVTKRQFGFRWRRDAETIVLLDILAADVNFGYNYGGWRVLTHFNGHHVRTLADLYSRWRTSVTTGNSFLEFRFSGGGRSIVLLTDAAERSAPSILAQHGIPAVASPDVRDGGRPIDSSGRAAEHTGGSHARREAVAAR